MCSVRTDGVTVGGSKTSGVGLGVAMAVEVGTLVAVGERVAEEEGIEVRKAVDESWGGSCEEVARGGSSEGVCVSVV